MRLTTSLLTILLLISVTSGQEARKKAAAREPNDIVATLKKRGYMPRSSIYVRPNQGFLAYDPEKAYVKVYSGRDDDGQDYYETYWLASDAEVTIDGQPASIADLQRGQEVSVFYKQWIWSEKSTVDRRLGNKVQVVVKLGAMSRLREVPAGDLPRKAEKKRSVEPTAKPKPKQEDPEQAAASKLRIAKLLIEDNKPDAGKFRLEQILKDYPKTRAAKDAAEILRKLRDR